MPVPASHGACTALRPLIPCAAAVSLAMVPVNAGVGAASAFVSDRALVLLSVTLCVLCSVALAWATAAAAVFFGAGVLLFVGTGEAGLRRAGPASALWVGG